MNKTVAAVSAALVGIVAALAVYLAVLATDKVRNEHAMTAAYDRQAEAQERIADHLEGRKDRRKAFVVCGESEEFTVGIEEKGRRELKCGGSDRSAKMAENAEWLLGAR